MGDGLPARSLVVQDGSIGPGVAAGKTHSARPRLSAPADEEIVSTVRLWGSVIELYSSMKKRLVKMLLDFSTTCTFISDVMAVALKMHIHEHKDFAHSL